MSKIIQLKDGSENVFPKMAPVYAADTNISAPTSTTQSSGTMLTLPPGDYLVVAHMQWSNSFVNTCNFNLVTTYQRTVRNTATNGGGTMNSMICSSTSNITVSASVWQNSGSTQTARVSIQALKIG